MMDKNSFQLKMQSKQLENEAKRMMKEAAKEKAKAKAALKKGNRPAAQLYAQNATRYEVQAQQLLHSAATTNGYATDLRAGAVAAQMSKNMQMATSGLEKNVAAVDVQKVSAQRTKMDGLKTKMAAANQLLTGEDDLEAQAGADDLLAALEAENEADAEIQLDAIPMGTVSVPAEGQKGGVKI
ncbi:SNF7 family protein [Trichomonas vaginalis G3]|uniref:SNF7 family protein n=1 Tax=Trichomonas vaginalis (strain ATCC PRA-98 / G3) TaxID=412133 RepID=A2G6Q9_TRIV3|nr:charged multivesicular body protein family [Trichomonas vaginalis G3]EAX87159.1 SNF7 family protein [Trichomonas vaginalis G3]KAI5512083.1 charged multivesicular body protein family [Trichomonas vaginalis G3]|eukprot:XP_001300089.1 SNF7 family protein [Trichomonas vaginalis G3]